MRTDNSEIPIHCAYDSLVPIEKIVPNPRNESIHPHNKSQIELLAKIIRAQGWRNAIVVSNRSGFITKGHGRLAAAQILKSDRVPVDYQDYATEAEEWADMIADNRIAELAEFNRPGLKDVMNQKKTNQQQNNANVRNADIFGRNKHMAKGKFALQQQTIPGTWGDIQLRREITSTRDAEHYVKEEGLPGYFRVIRISCFIGAENAQKITTIVQPVYNRDQRSMDLG